MSRHSHVRYAWHWHHTAVKVEMAASTSSRCQTPPHPSLRSHRKHDKLHPPAVSLRLILCVLKHKTQPRAIFPLCTLSPDFPSRRSSFGDAGDGCGRESNREEHLRYRSACTACASSTPDCGETPWSSGCPVRVSATDWPRTRRQRAGSPAAYAFLNQGPVFFAVARV